MIYEVMDLKHMYSNPFFFPLGSDLVSSHSMWATVEFLPPASLSVHLASPDFTFHTTILEEDKYLSDMWDGSLVATQVISTKGSRRPDRKLSNVWATNLAELA